MSPPLDDPTQPIAGASLPPVLGTATNVRPVFLDSRGRRKTLVGAAAVTAGVLGLGFVVAVGLLFGGSPTTLWPKVIGGLNGLDSALGESEPQDDQLTGDGAGPEDSAGSGAATHSLAPAPALPGPARTPSSATPPSVSVAPSASQVGPVAPLSEPPTTPVTPTTTATSPTTPDTPITGAPGPVGDQPGQTPTTNLP
jgi:hypothetical protein